MDLLDALGATNELDVARATLTAAAVGIPPLWPAAISVTPTGH
jgi:hypothetical protein